MASNKAYIRNFVDPTDGEIGFGTNTLFKYFERKVYGLKNNWEEETEAAIQNLDLYLQIGDDKYPPDPLPINKGFVGYFISFTINMDSYQQNRIEYVDITYSESESDLRDTRFTVRRYEARVQGLMIPKPIPICAAQRYLDKLISEDIERIGTIVSEVDGQRVRIDGTLYHGKELFVYGKKIIGVSADASEKINTAGKLIHHMPTPSSDVSAAPYIEDHTEPVDGKLIFSNNTVYDYYERRVYGLTGSWEDGTEAAIMKGDIFLIKMGEKYYPDKRKINRGPLGYYVSFTVDVDIEQARQVIYLLVSVSDKSDTRPYQYEAIATGLPIPKVIPEAFARNYLNKLIALNLCCVGYMEDKHGNMVKLKHVDFVDGELKIFGDECSSDVAPPAADIRQMWQYNSPPSKYHE